MKTSEYKVGMGFRRPHYEAIKLIKPEQVEFFELAPENWIGMGGKRKQEIEYIAAHYPLVCHGLSLSIGGPGPLNMSFLKQVKQFLDDFDIPLYTEHLSYCGDESQMFDLLPIPFTQEAVYYTAERIKQVQDIIEKPFAVENVSYYLEAGAELSELEFINAVLTEANCGMLLDVNNIYVNSINHNYDPKQFLKSLKPKDIAYIHIAGHYQSKADLIIDTHAEDIIDPVWELLDLAYKTFGIAPTILERDDNLPSLETMLLEIDKIHSIQGEQYG
jgi:hypothetical protein